MPALPTGIASAPGRLAELLDHLEGGRLLALYPVGVDRIDQLDRVLLGELADDRQGVVEVSLEGDDAGAVHERLGELADRDLALRDDHRAAQPGPGRVGGGAGRGVAGRGADHRLRPPALGPRDRDRHPPVLEASGRVRALELEMDAGADPLREPGRLDQRRRALLEADHGVARLERQPVPVSLDQTLPQTNSSSITRMERGAERTSSSRADLLDGGCELGLEALVDDHHQPRVVADPALDDALHRDPVVAQHLGDAGEDAGASATSRCR